MRLTILGCSGSMPGPGTAASGYLLESDGFVLGVELGNGTLASLQRLRDPFDLDALLFSHLHPDHCADFSALAVLRRYHPDPPYDRRPHQLPVYAPVEAPERFANAYAPHESERMQTDLGDVFKFHSLRPGALSIGPFEITAAPVKHPTSAFGLRFEAGGRSLTYTGDTGPCGAVDELAAHADVLLAEATWTHAPQRPADLHLSGTQAGVLAREARVGSLLLTHIAPWTDSDAVLAEAAEEFTGPSAVVQQGASYSV